MPELLEKAALEDRLTSIGTNCDNEDNDNTSEMSDAKEMENGEDLHREEDETSSGGEENEDDDGDDENKLAHPAREKNESSEAKKVWTCLRLDLFKPHWLRSSFFLLFPPKKPMTESILDW